MLLPMAQATDPMTHPSYRQTKRTELKGREWKGRKGRGTTKKTPPLNLGDSGQADILHDKAGCDGSYNPLPASSGLLSL